MKWQPSPGVRDGERQGGASGRARRQRDPHRPHSLPRHTPLVSILLVLAGIQTAATAKDFFLTIGGGYSPDGNQVSLERNVVFFQEVLKRTRSDEPEHWIMFADGDDAARDLQYRDADSMPEAVQILAEVFGDPDEATLAYRNHEVQPIIGSARTRRLKQRIARIARDAQPGDRLFIYVTAHGGSARDKESNPYDTMLYMWDDDKISASEFTKVLERLPQELKVVMVMVQCYSGGFANTIFDRATSELGLAPQVRCGFFSQVHDRVAAGCTPDIDEANYQEYSSFFWAAIGGQTRAGEALTVDYNNDGETSLAEAHAYAVITSDTIDIPIRTSDALLRHYSRLAKTASADPDESEDVEESSTINRILRGLSTDPEHGPPKAKLLPLVGSLEEIVEGADHVDRAIVEGLAQRLEIDLKIEVSEFRELLGEASKKMKRAESSLGRASNRYRRVRSEVRSRVRKHWPELATNVSPTLAKLLHDDAQTLVDFVKGERTYDVMIKAKSRRDELLEQSLDADRLEAKMRRLDAALKRIVLTHNLRVVGSPEIVEHFEQLLDLENSTIK